MKRHLWGREVKHGSRHFERPCDRKGCPWSMVRTQDPKGRFSGSRPAVRIRYRSGETVVDEVPDCIESGEKPQPG